MNIGKALGKLFLDQVRTPFKWGAADCVTWAGDCALAVTGTDPIAHVRGRYQTETGARRILVRKGWRTVAGLAASIYAEIPVAHARAGDWMVIAREDGELVLGVSFGERIIARSPDGLGALPLLAASRAFRVTAPGEGAAAGAAEASAA